MNAAVGFVVIILVICLQLRMTETAVPCNEEETVHNWIAECESIDKAISLLKKRKGGSLEEMLIEDGNDFGYETEELINRFIRVLDTPGHKYGEP